MAGPSPQERTEDCVKVFFNKRDAEKWGRERETAVDLGQPILLETLDTTLGDILLRYQTEITPAKKGRDAETRRLIHLQKDQLSRTAVTALDAPMPCEFRDRRLKDGKRACQYDLVLIRHALEIARKEWGLPIAANPVNNIRVPNGIRARERRLQPEEFIRLKQAAITTRNSFTWPAILLALETAMRRSELLRLCWEDVDFKERLAHLGDTKNGHPRSVPLTEAAIAILSALPNDSERVLPISDYALRQSWERLVSRAEIIDLHFHDLRHEAISRFFERGLSVPEVALISGHRDPRMLFRYTHLRAENVVAKLYASEAA